MLVLRGMGGVNKINRHAAGLENGFEMGHFVFVLAEDDFAHTVIFPFIKLVCHGREFRILLKGNELIVKVGSLNQVVADMPFILKK